MATAPRRIERAIRRRLFGAEDRAADREPPKCPPGWSTGPPDFVGVGVQRSGTSWWFKELCRHPDLQFAPGAPKEVHFFDPFSNRTFADADAERYRRWFPRPPGATTGEWTPMYSYQPWTAGMIAHAAPEARSLILLRDPVDRFRSGMSFQMRRGRSHFHSLFDAFHRGLYAGQIARLLTHIPRDRLLVLVYEELRAEPEAARRRTAEFLGLDPDRFDQPVTVYAPKAERSAQVELADDLLAELRARYRDDFEALQKLLPDLDLARWPTVKPP